MHLFLVVRVRSGHLAHLHTHTHTHTHMYKPLCTICNEYICETCAQCCCVRCRGAAANTKCHPLYVHPTALSSGPGSTQTHGLPGDKLTSPEYFTDSVDSPTHTKLSSDELKEKTKHQGSKVSNASQCTHMQSLVTTHQDVTCTSFLPTMQVPSEPVGRESDLHEEPEPVAVKGESRVAVCLSMLVPTFNMRRCDADMLHHSLPTL